MYKKLTADTDTTALWLKKTIHKAPKLRNTNDKGFVQGIGNNEYGI